MASEFGKKNAQTLHLSRCVHFGSKALTGKCTNRQSLMCRYACPEDAMHDAICLGNGLGSLMFHALQVASAHVCIIGGPALLEAGSAES